MSDDKPIAKPASTAAVDVIWKELSGIFANVIKDLDERKASATVAAMRERYPDETTDQIVERLIRDKCLRAAGVGAVSSGAAIVPGIGTFASLTVGIAADIGMTFKLQAELALEVAAAHGRRLSESEKRSSVMLITGMSSGANQVLKQATTKATQVYAEKWVAHALPTYVVEHQAKTTTL